MVKAKTENEAEPTVGHNSLKPAELVNFCERIEALIEDRKVVNADVKQVLEEAEHLGYDKKVIKDMIKIRAMDPEERDERLALTDMYLKALGLL